MGLQLCLLYIPLYSRHFCQYRGVMSTLTKQLFRSIKVMNLICRWLIMLTRGPNSTQPCPICCVPEEYLDAIDLSFQHHDTVACRDVYEKALLAEMEAEANHICKVKVCTGPHGLSYITFLTRKEYKRTLSTRFLVHA